MMEAVPPFGPTSYIENWSATTVVCRFRPVTAILLRLTTSVPARARLNRHPLIRAIFAEEAAHHTL